MISQSQVKVGAFPRKWYAVCDSEYVRAEEGCTFKAIISSD